MKKVVSQYEKQWMKWRIFNEYFIQQDFYRSNRIDIISRSREKRCSLSVRSHRRDAEMAMNVYDIVVWLRVLVVAVPIDVVVAIEVAVVIDVAPEYQSRVAFHAKSLLRVEKSAYTDPWKWSVPTESRCHRYLRTSSQRTYQERKLNLKTRIERLKCFTEKSTSYLPWNIITSL